MDKQKQIEEMIDVQKNNCASKVIGDCVDAECNACTALAFYNAGYRKIPEGVDWLDGYKLGFKEGVQALKIQVEQAICDNTYPSFDKKGKPVNIWNAVVGFDKIDEICKELTK